jgi:hypothetical protein
LAALEQHPAIGAGKSAARIRAVCDDLSDCELAGKRLALRFEIDSCCEAFELAAAGIRAAKVGDERREVAASPHHNHLGLIVVGREGFFLLHPSELRFAIGVEQIWDRNLGEARGGHRGQRRIRRVSLGRSNSCCAQGSTKEQRWAK